jgi:transaldolase
LGAFLDGQAVEYAKSFEFAQTRDTREAEVNLAMDRLAVNLGREIVKLVPGYVSTEVDPKP